MGSLIRLHLVLVVAALGCAAPPPVPLGKPSVDGAAAAAPKHVTIAIASNLASVSAVLNRGAAGARPGTAELEQLVHAGLAVADERGHLRPQLAVAVPLTDTGSWRLLPDGRMETTWTIREGARWQDGVAFTSADLVFTAAVIQDRELPMFRQRAFDAIERIAAPDARTIVVSWTQPFIEADTLFSAASGVEALPLPRHLLEAAYQENKAGFADLAYWSEGFVGAGPFRVREWVRGSHLLLGAHDRYVLGRPNIDVVEVKFVPDPAAMLAHVLAGTVDVIGGQRSASLETGLHLLAQWSGGAVHFAPAGGATVVPQMTNPRPAIIAEVRFRRALLQAIDREEIVATIMAGKSPVAHSTVNPTELEYVELAPFVVRYDYNPRLATQALEALGYTRGADGGFRDSAGQRLAVELRASPLDVWPNTKLAVADYWQRVGVASTLVEDSDAQRRNLEYRANFPGFDVSGAGTGAKALHGFHSAEARLPEHGYVGQNAARYVNAELDALIDRYVVSVPRGARLQLAGQIVRQLTDQVVPLPLFYRSLPIVVSHRMQNVAIEVAWSQTNTWNAHEWDVR
jgi:peptide/nickel transport system substrate-binding protein